MFNQETPDNQFLYAVSGDPVLHSRSPQMYNAAFAALKIPAIYLRLAAPDAAGALQSAKEIGLSGLNITSPFKEKAAILTVCVDQNVSRLKAVNTLIAQEGVFHGYNTDPEGVIKALTSHGINPAKLSALVLGGGGAARAAAYALRHQGAQVTVANRSLEKAKRIAKELHCRYASLAAQDLEQALGSCSVVISCLSTTEAVVPRGFLRPSHVVLDANYTAHTELAKDAKQSGATVISGLEWLLYQGAKAFELFTGRAAPVDIMRAALENQTRIPPKGRLSLIGFMGSGKSEVGREVSKLLGIPLLDLDAEIEKEAGCKVEEIFSRDGEERFRRLEQQKLTAAAESKNVVLAAGGGVVLDRDNRRFLRENFLNIWLWATAQTVYERLGHDNSRPLFKNRDKKETINELMHFRRPLYAEVSDLVVSTERKTPFKIAQEIYHNWRAIQGQAISNNDRD